MLAAVLALIKGSGSIALALGFPAGQNMVEGAEASMMTGASAARAGWRKAFIAAGAGVVTLLPVIAGFWFAYRLVPAEYIDYAIALLIFGIGIHEIMEGLGDKPSREGPRRHPLGGPLGIDPADPAAISRFQEAHGLERDGVLGPLTRGAILGELRRRGEEPQPNRLGLDVTDEDSIRRFQRRLGLQPDGIVGPVTQGALAAEASFRLVDPADRRSVEWFQSEHRLPVTGVVDAATQSALRAIHAERRDAVDGNEAGSSPLSDDRRPRPPYPLDVTSSADVRRFQQERGIAATGVVDRTTQGALRAEIERQNVRLGLDPAEPASVRAFQQTQGLEETGIVDAPTQEALAAERDALEPTTAEQRTVLGIDPTDPDSISSFQARHGLDRTGEIDAETQEELRRREEWTAGLDPADPESVVRFQAAHGLAETGVVDLDTQGAIRLYRQELESRHEAENGNASDGDRGWYPLDPSDPDSIGEFQREHELSVDSTIGPETQHALRAVLAERTRQRGREQKAEQGGILGTYGPVWPAYFGTILEGGEASLFTIALGHGTGHWYLAAIGGGGGFILPWFVLLSVRDWVERQPEWLFQLVIGIVLASAATIFGLLRTFGGFGS